MREKPLTVAAISERAAGSVRRALERRQALRATLHPGVLATPIVMDNILAIVEGRSVSAEIVVVGAHLDHDGIDEKGRIYNGADDNASGTAAVIAMATAFARAAAEGARPARAIVFALWNGEEKGSLGAEFYAGHPVPARRIAANVNLDMVGRDEDIADPDDPRFQGFGKSVASQNTNVLHLLGYTYSPDLARLAELANETIQLTIKQTYDRDSQNLIPVFPEDVSFSARPGREPMEHGGTGQLPRWSRCVQIPTIPFMPAFVHRAVDKLITLGKRSTIVSTRSGAHGTRRLPAHDRSSCMERGPRGPMRSLATSKAAQDRCAHGDSAAEPRLERRRQAALAAFTRPSPSSASTSCADRVARQPPLAQDDPPGLRAHKADACRPAGTCAKQVRVVQVRAVAGNDGVAPRPQDWWNVDGARRHSSFSQTKSNAPCWCSSRSSSSSRR